MLGGAVERRYRKLRPDVERLPWGTIRTASFPSKEIVRFRRAWTEAAFQEHRTGAACALALESLIACRAPLDLVALASRFPLDELAHVEMCARIAGEFGGGYPLRHRPAELVAPARDESSVLARASELMVRFFCVGEAVSIPMLRGAWHSAVHPLIRAVIGRIVKDEAAHGQIGWMFLDWALPELSERDIRSLRENAKEAIAEIEKRFEHAGGGSELAEDVHALGWMTTDEYVSLGRRALESHVLKPLRERGIAPA